MVFSSIFHRRCRKRQLPGRFDFHGHIGNNEAQSLELGYQLPELLALLGIAYSGVKRRLRDAQRLSGNSDPSAVQSGHGDRKAHPLFAQAVFHRYAAIFKNQVGGVRSAQPHLVFQRSDGQPRHPLLNDKGADSFVTSRSVCFGSYHDQPGILCSGNKPLGAVEYVIPAVSDGLCALSDRIRTGMGFGQRKRANDLPGGQLCQVFLFLLFAAVAQNTFTHDGIVHGHHHCRGGTGVGHF